MVHTPELDRFNGDEDFFFIDFNSDTSSGSKDFNDFSEDHSFLFSESEQSQVPANTWTDPELSKKYDNSFIPLTPSNVTPAGPTVKRAELGNISEPPSSRSDQKQT